MKQEKKTSRIEIEVTLNEKQYPSDIVWGSDNAADENQVRQAAKAMFLSFFDKESRDTLKIDLWTTDFQVDEMDRFMYFTLRSLTDSYFKATNNQQLANEMQRFVQYFGEKTGIIQGGSS